MCALEVRAVREILASATVTRVPTAPAAWRGVTNVRGAVIPALDLGIRLAGVPANGPLVIVETEAAGACALVAERVLGIHAVDREALRSPPAALLGRAAALVRHLAAVEAVGDLPVLDLERLLDPEEIRRASLAVGSARRPPRALPPAAGTAGAGGGEDRQRSATGSSRISEEVRPPLPAAAERPAPPPSPARSEPPPAPRVPRPAPRAEPRPPDRPLPAHPPGGAAVPAGGGHPVAEGAVHPPAGPRGPGSLAPALSGSAPAVRGSPSPVPVAAIVHAEPVRAREATPPAPAVAALDPQAGLDRRLQGGPLVAPAGRSARPWLAAALAGAVALALAGLAWSLRGPPEPTRATREEARPPAVAERQRAADLTPAPAAAAVPPRPAPPAPAAAVQPSPVPAPAAAPTPVPTPHAASEPSTSAATPSRPAPPPSPAPAVTWSAAPPPPAGAAPVSPVVVKRGDTLWDLAGRYRGDAREWRSLYDANRAKIADPDLIRPGQQLVIPGATEARAADREPR